MTEELKVNTPADKEKQLTSFSQQALQFGGNAQDDVSEGEAPDINYTDECSSDKCLGFIKGNIGMHLVGGL